MRAIALGCIGLFAFGCGDTQPTGPIMGAAPDAGASADGAPPPPVDERAAYVFSSMLIPTSGAQATALGLDIDGDSEVDNQLGKVIATVGAVGGDLNLQASLDQSVADGTVIVLADLGYNSVDSGDGVFTLYEGSNPSVAPCGGACGQHLDGATSFTATSLPGGGFLAGALTAKAFTGGPGTMTIPLPLGEPILVDVIAARTVFTVSEDGLTSGRLGGGITEEEIKTTLMPGVHGIITTAIGSDCNGESPNCCVADSTGDTLVGLFDENGDCSVSLEEIENNGLLQTLLAPDLDLLDENGQPGTDGVDDSLSVGIGFSAVGATFDAP